MLLRIHPLMHAHKLGYFVIFVVGDISELYIAGGSGFWCRNSTQDTKHQRLLKMIQAHGLILLR